MPSFCDEAEYLMAISEFTSQREADMYCDFVRVNQALVRCRCCGHQVNSPLPIAQIRVRCQVRHSHFQGAHLLVPTPRPAPVAERPPIRAVLMTPGLQMGGAEIWVRTMVTEMDSRRIQWQAVLLAHSFTQIADQLIRPIAERTRVIAPQADASQPEYAGLIERFPSRREASQAALEGAEVVVCWAVGGILPEMVAEFTGPVVAVSHGVCRWTKADMAQQLNEGATHAVAVGALAAAVCPDPASTRVILNGVSPDRVKPRRSREAVRAEWGIEDDETILVGYVGRFAPEKNATAAALAVSKLPERFLAVLVGEAAYPALTEVTHRAVDAMVGPRGGLISATDDVGDIYAAIDVLVMASPAEGCSLTLVEAFLAGVPVVSTPVGIVSDLAHQHGSVVYPVPIDPTAEELAQAVRSAAQGGRSAEIVQRAQRVAREDLTAEKMTDSWASFLEEITPQPGHFRLLSSRPQVSIVVPAWNEAPRIEKSLRSLLAQTDQDFELIVVDDGSRDDTAAVARSILAGRPQTQVLQKQNGGTGSALNLGFSVARGEYLTWWSADCWVYPHWLEKLGSCLEAHPEVVMAYSDWRSVDDRNGASAIHHVPEFDKERLLHDCYVGPCWLFRRTAKEIAGRYLEEPCEDYDMHLRLSEVGPFRRVPHILGVWRNHSLNVSNRLISNPETTQWHGQSARIQERHRQRTHPNQ